MSQMNRDEMVAALLKGEGLPPEVLAGTDPRLRLLEPLLARRDPEAAAGGDPIRAAAARIAGILDTDISAGAAVPRQRPGQRGTRPRRRPPRGSLAEELGELHARNETLAAALGACDRCWGDDPQCPDCDGHGAPGAAVPDRALFRALVAPALSRLRAESARAPRPTPDPSGPPGTRTGGPPPAGPLPSTQPKRSS